jgi:hypothetical protein
MLAVVEIALRTGALESWMRFVAFGRASNDTFQQVANYRGIVFKVRQLRHCSNAPKAQRNM